MVEPWELAAISAHRVQLGRRILGRQPHDLRARELGNRSERRSPEGVRRSPLTTTLMNPSRPVSTAHGVRQIRVENHRHPLLREPTRVVPHEEMVAVREAQAGWRVCDAGGRYHLPYRGVDLSQGRPGGPVLAVDEGEVMRLTAEAP